MTTLTPFRMFEPFRSLLPLSREFFGEEPGGNLWDRFASGDVSQSWNWTPRFDIIEKPDSYVFKTELPGMEADDVDVTLTGDLLTIKGEKKKEETREEDHYRITERVFGSFQRSFNIPGAIDPNSLEAELKNGVLDITVAKTKESRPSRIKVKAH